MDSSRIITLALCSAILLSCSSGGQKQTQTNDSVVPENTQEVLPNLPASEQQVKVSSDTTLLEIAKGVLKSLKVGDNQVFARYIHPELGVRFSPYANVDTANNIRLRTPEFLAVVKSNEKLNWGNYDGSGEPISLPIGDYFKKFVYNADFLHPEKFSVNKVAKKGNIPSNIEQVYSNCKYVESYFSGFDKKYEGMDWCALRLVFKEYKGTLYLVGVIHAQWTT